MKKENLDKLQTMLDRGWAIEYMTGYAPKTTFWSDFNIAEHFGCPAINDTCRRAFEEWKTNVEYVTELVMVLNHKIWQWYDYFNKETDEELKAYLDSVSRLYDELWREADDWCCDNLKGKDAEYFYRVTD